MQLQLRDNLPFCAVSIGYRGQAATVAQALIDTGSARTIFAAHVVSAIGITPEPDDVLDRAGACAASGCYRRSDKKVRVG